jgi:uncharacterized FlaG/YvyC family protein
MQEFDNEFIYLESNVKRTHPDQVSNSLSNFNTHLAKKFNFSSDWEVGLAEISYSKSWFNLMADERIAVYDKTETQWESISVLKSGHYANVEHLLKSINKLLENIGTELNFQGNYKAPQLIYDNSTRKIAIEIGYFTEPNSEETTIDKSATIVVIKKGEPSIIILPKFSPRLNFILGLIDKQGRELSFTSTSNVIAIDIEKFKREIRIGKAILLGYREVTLDASIRSLFVYCNIIQPISVGDTYAQLLRQVEIPTDKQFGDQVDIKYQKLYYIPLLYNEIDSIEIDIKDDTNTPINFEFGKTSLVLHFRRRKNVTKSIYDLLR